jgi:hypothetical protein
MPRRLTSSCARLADFSPAIFYNGPEQLLFQPNLLLRRTLTSRTRAQFAVAYPSICVSPQIEIA